MADAEKKVPATPILSRLSPAPGSTKAQHRIGRGPGSGWGKTSGKGQKGQKARGTVAPRFEGGQMPLHRRLPKVGFRNFFSLNVATVNVGMLMRFEAGAVVDPAALTKARLVRGRCDSVKILGHGTLDKPLRVRAHAFSEGARALIEKAGGSAEVITREHEKSSENART